MQTTFCEAPSNQGPVLSLVPAWQTVAKASLAQISGWSASTITPHDSFNLFIRKSLLSADAEILTVEIHLHLMRWYIQPHTMTMHDAAH